uniref:Serine/threonine-protein phosphatase 7 long form homolog n=1 Tax=Nicotiana tabacum TaxID=4097 RepID=A0A1S4BJH1_TOBAC|nr:PREDICTED: serine/threonine-protein phosphatase 7 long form homolog [Nicotiana tabacum]
MEVPPVHPGPASLELLLLQGEHRSSYIWDGQCLSQTFRARRIDDMWEFIRDRSLHPCIVRRLPDTSFYRIIEIGRLQFDWALITAMIERWRPETHTFHLPVGEATITLEDVEVLFGLPVDGLPPAEETALSGATHLQLTPVRQHLEVMDAEITDDSPPEVIDRHTRLVLLLMFGGVLFPNTSENLVNLRFLHHLERLVDLPGYSWGAAVLGYLYRQMCRASMGTQRDGAGFLPLLQFLWRPYSDALIASLPDNCSRGRAMWSSSVPLICLDIVEHHSTERVLRQFGRPKLVPIPPACLRTHYQRDDHSRVD